MSRSLRETTQSLYDAIRRDYESMSRKDEQYGVRKYSDAYIFETLGRRYFRSAKTIENIVFHRV